MDAKDLMIARAVLNVLEVYSEQEIGYRAEVNTEKLLNYVKALATTWLYKDARTIDECCEIFLSEILKGEPVWRLLEIPEWTAKMLEREFADLIAEREAALKRKYKCLTCIYYKAIETQMGIIDQCTYKPPTPDGSMLKHRATMLQARRGEQFKLKTRCNKYVAQEEQY